MIRDRQPSVREIIDALDRPTHQIDWCTHKPSGKRVKPAELWIESIGTWLRADGSHASFVLNGQVHFGIIATFRLRNAVKRWIKQEQQS